MVGNGFDLTNPNFGDRWKQVTRARMAAGWKDWFIGRELYKAYRPSSVPRWSTS